MHGYMHGHMAVDLIGCRDCHSEYLCVDATLIDIVLAKNGFHGFDLVFSGRIGCLYYSIV